MVIEIAFGIFFAYIALVILVAIIEFFGEVL